MATATADADAIPRQRRARTTSRRVRWVDRGTSMLITVGGILVIVAVMGILVYLAVVVRPLFTGADITESIMTSSGSKTGHGYRVARFG